MCIRDRWQIEALRRLEIPEDMQRQHGFAPLGAADGPVKTAIFSGNALRIYKLDPASVRGAIDNDHVAEMRQAFLAAGVERSNRRYGYVARAGT